MRDRERGKEERREGGREKKEGKQEGSKRNMLMKPEDTWSWRADVESSSLDLRITAETVSKIETM